MFATDAEGQMSARDPHELLPLTHVTYHVLLSLADEDRHGYGIIKEVAGRTGGRIELETGTLYAALKRYRDDRLIEVAPKSTRPPDEDSRRRAYRLTAFGRQVLRAESERLAELLDVAVEKKVLPATQP